MIGPWKSKYAELEKGLGYRFRRKRLLEIALTHRSYRFENTGVSRDNQRLEYLGDAALGLVAADYVYHAYRDLQEGALTTFRSQITRGEALAEVGRDVGVGQFLLIGKGEDRSGGRDRTSNLADAMESILGAAYLDGGVSAVERVFKKLFVPRLDELGGDLWAGNPKGELQEYCQRVWKTSPRYRVLRQHGPAHARRFTCEVELRDGTTAQGAGQNKQAAETDAARRALKMLADH